MRRPLPKLVAACLLWLLFLAFIPSNRYREQSPVSSQGTAPADWSTLRTALEARSDFYRWASQLPPPTTAPNVAPLGAPSASGGNHRGYATARECVSMRENGGSYSESSNPTHKGRYQFARSTWISFGGVAGHWDDWSLTSPGEQDAVFDAAWNSPHGPANWLPYDHC